MLHSINYNVAIRRVLFSEQFRPEPLLVSEHDSGQGVLRHSVPGPTQKGPEELRDKDGELIRSL